MYMRQENCLAHQRLWSLIQTGLNAAGVAAPLELSDTVGVEHWLDDNLVLSQTCSLPFRRDLVGKVQLIGTPDYGLPDCPEGYYRSRLVVRADKLRSEFTDFDQAVIAVNDQQSQSGFAAPMQAAKKAGIEFSEILVSGSHQRSCELVVAGDADIAAVDAVTWSMIEQFNDFTDELIAFDSTDPTPGLPLICSLSQPVAKIRAQVIEAIGRLTKRERAVLRVEGLVSISQQTYLNIE